MKIRSTAYGIPYEEGKPSSDAFAVRESGQTVVAVLCDGAGTGAPAREAAERAVRSVTENYWAKPRSWQPQRALSEFTHLINRTLHQESMARFDGVEMVSTLAAAVIEGDRLYGINVGDSRVCVLRDGRLVQLSQDHVSADQGNMLTRALGLGREIEPHVFESSINAGDVVVLCSDGVSNHFTSETMSEALQKCASALTLVTDARSRAVQESLDDMSAIVLDVAETGKLRSMNDRQLTIPEALHKGDVFDGYQLVRQFQNAERVWLADKDGMRVVLKFAPREAIDSEAHLNAFTRETWNATRLTEECFARAFEPLGQTARYYVMEFVDAPNLASVLQARRLSVDSAIGLGLFLCEAGLALLRHDLVHGDVKPENVLCLGDYARLTFKLVDIGSAAGVFSVTSRAGTPSYLAPERFRQSPVSERTEIFAIGVTLYQALTGELPYGAIERFQTPSFGAPKRAALLNPNIPHWLDAVIMRSIARKPERRYQNYSELAFDLAHPEKVEACFEEDAPLLERNPLLFYKTGFFILAALCLWLAFKLLTHP